MNFDFNAAAPQPMHLSECHQLLEGLWKHCQIQQKTLAQLKEKLKADSANSSRPPSSDSLRTRLTRAQQSSEDWQKRTTTYWQKRQRGAQKGHVGHGRKLCPLHLVDEVIPCYPSKICDYCCKDLPFFNLRRRKQVFEVHSGKLQITEYQIYGGFCSSCKKVTRGKIPPGVPVGILGAQILGYIGALSGKYRLSKREIKEIVWDFFGLNISVGTVSNAEALISQSLEKPVEEVRQALQKHAYMHVDETSHSHQWKLEWLWVGATHTFTYFKIFKHRNTESAQTLIGKDFTGIIISDRYGAYNWLASKQRQYCWAHLKRDFKKMAEQEDIQEKEIGCRLLRVYKTLFTKRHLLPTTGSTILLNTLRRFRHCLRDGRLLRGTWTSAFCRKLMKGWRSLWHFLRCPDISPTNNQAERQLRHGVIWRKKCFGTQSTRGKEFVERVLTSVLTCKQQKRNVADFLSNCVKAFWSSGRYPSLIFE